MITLFRGGVNMKDEHDESISNRHVDANVSGRPSEVNDAS